MKKSLSLGRCYRTFSPIRAPLPGRVTRTTDPRTVCITNPWAVYRLAIPSDDTLRPCIS